MSALTKLFVVLLVVCALLLSASVVVFVNRTEDFNDAKVKAEAALKKSEQGELAARAEATAAKQAADNLATNLRNANAQADAMQRTLQQQISQRDVAVAELKSSNAQQAMAMTTLSEGLKASEDQKAQQQTQLADLRGGMDKLVKERADLNQALSDSTNKLDAMTREWRFFQEQLAESRAQNEKLTARVKDAGLSMDTPAGVRGGAPAIIGEIREVKSIDNIPYATISVGSADSVTKDMEFNIIDKASGTWLGTLKVDRAEPQEAVGRLSGPKVGEVRKGNEVRTQL